MDQSRSEFLPAIEKLVADITARDNETAEMKRMVNKLCGFAKLPPRYADIGPEGGGGGGLKADQFYGKPLATAVREYLEMRGSPAAGLGAATVKEIFTALKEGGFAFDTKNDDNAMRGLRISLAKNTVTFHKLPNGQFGLLAWYPNAKAPRNQTTDEADDKSVVTSEKTEATTTEKVAAAS